MTTTSYMTTYPPTVVVTKRNPEQRKYVRLWNEHCGYRKIAPGAYFVEKFLHLVNPNVGSHIIDFGCGTGRGAAKLHKAGLKVSMLDFAENCLDENIKERLCESFTFQVHDMSDPSPIVAEYGYCTDFMEHIPPDMVNTVLENILRGAKTCFFAIAKVKDSCGEDIGEVLHLSVHSYEWWLEKFKEMSCKIIWSKDDGEEYALFLVTAWEEAQVIVEHGELNVAPDKLKENTAYNCAQGWKQVSPYEEQDVEVMIIGGGPSLNEHLEEIKAKREAGAKLVTLNGAYNWCLQHGMVPSATIIVDAREFNKRFVDPVVDDCVYLIASQCDPAVLEGLPKDRTYLWHVYGKYTEEVVPQHYETCYPIPGGSTVLLRTIPLLRTLGFHRFHLYGCDSCLSEKEAHHAYSQPENDNKTVVNIMVTGGRVFKCHPWMAVQAREFITLVKNLGDTFDLIVHGDGLLSHIINTGASLAPNEEE